MFTDALCPDWLCSVEDCDTNNPILFEQPVFQSLK